MGSQPTEPNSHLGDHIAAISELHQHAEHVAGRSQQQIEKLTRILGRPSTAYGAVGLIGGWIVVNLLLGPSGRAFDPPPFSYLQGATAISALMMAIMILITENRQSRMAMQRSHLDLQVNLLAEKKIAKVIALLEELRRDLPSVANRRDGEADELSRPADPRHVAGEIEKELLR